jgi:hypothetical protein
MQMVVISLSISAYVEDVNRSIIVFRRTKHFTLMKLYLELRVSLNFVTILSQRLYRILPLICIYICTNFLISNFSPL